MKTWSNTSGFNQVLSITNQYVYTMKKYVLFLFSFICTMFSQSNAKDFDIVITLNLKDCLNCVHAFYDMQQLKDKANIFLVINEEYRSDSAYIDSTYHLSDLNPSYIWSDEIFSAYAPNGNSTVSLESRYKTKRLTYPTTLLPRDFVAFVAGLDNSRDTLFTDIPQIARGVEDIRFNGREMVLFVNYRKEIDVYDLVSQKLNYKINIGEELLRKTFAFTGLPPEDFDRQQKTMEAAGVPERYQIQGISFLADTIVTLFDTRYFSYGDLDTSLEHSLSLVKFYKGKPVAVHKIDRHIELDHKIYHFRWPIYCLNGQTYIGIGYSPATPNRYFLGKFNLYGDEYRVEKGLNRKIPALYDRTEGCSFPVYYQHHYAFPLIGKIFSFDNDEEIDLKFFPKDNNFWGKDCNYCKMFIMSYIMNEEYVWLVMDNNPDGKGFMVEMVKYNISAGKAEFSKLKFPRSGNNVVALDPINPDYIIYKGKDARLIRTKVF